MIIKSVITLNSKNKSTKEMCFNMSIHIHTHVENSSCIEKYKIESESFLPFPFLSPQIISTKAITVHSFLKFLLFKKLCLYRYMWIKYIYIHNHIPFYLHKRAHTQFCTLIFHINMVFWFLFCLCGIRD